MLKKRLLLAVIVFSALCIGAYFAWASPTVVTAFGGSDVPPRVWEALQHADRSELLSIEPTRSSLRMERSATSPSDANTASPSTSTSDATEELRGFKVLGRTAVSDAATRTKLNEALRAGVRDDDGRRSLCAFQPRHAIRVAGAGESFDILICFHCGDIFVHDRTRPESDRGTYVHVSRMPQPVYDAVLTDAGIPLAPE